MSRYKAYPEYKDSGVEWLGEIPPHWHSRQLKYLCSYNDEVLSETASDDYEIEYVDISSVSAINGISSTETMLFGNAPSRARRIVRDGDILISTVRTYLEAIASVQAPPNNLIASTGFAVIRPNLFLNKGYTAYCLRATGFIKEVVARSVGVSYPAINASDLVNIKTPEPSMPEQEKIAAFLDHETAKIDALIEKQQRLIELLKEKRQAVISHAVTKGIDPNAPMKDSGVEWLGEVPVHWSLKKISHIGRVLNGSTPDKSKFSFWNEGSIPWLASSCLNSPTVDEPTELISAQAFERSSLELIPAGSLLVGMVGQGKTRGTSAVLTIESCINQNMAAIIPSKHVNINFLYYLFQAMYHDLRELGRGGNQAALNCEIVASIRVPIPAIEEQQCIVSFISKQLAVMILATDSADQQIKLLHERRSALISAAVTGKIDVRDWQAAA